MITDKVREEIESLLLKAQNYLAEAIGLGNQAILATYYIDLIQVLKKHGLPLLNLEVFESIVEDLRKNSRRDKKAAIDKVMKDIAEYHESQNDEPLFKISKVKASKRPHRQHQGGQKRGRDLIWDDTKIVWDMLENPQSPFYLSIKYRILVWLKALLIVQGIKDDKAYIAETLGILPFEMEDEELQKAVMNLNDQVSEILDILNKYLAYIPELIKEKPNCKKWFMDVFGYSIFRHLPDEPVNVKPSVKRKAEFHRSYSLLVKFINGATYRELGYSKKTYHNFTDFVGLKGLVFFLNRVHKTVYDLVESHLIGTAVMVYKIENLFKDLPRGIYRNAIVQLYKKEFPDLYARNTIEEFSDQFPNVGFPTPLRSRLSTDSVLIKESQ
ncbi:MAG: hypothetical protein AB7Y74_15850 [Syntrophorhabdus sp.]